MTRSSKPPTEIVPSLSELDAFDKDCLNQIATQVTIQYVRILYKVLYR